ncbi:unnamed protein product [Thelazia callipaeda]|uniref:Transcription initiation factor TFIID subunit 8 n=1 Tax=Thelazia callipaeda TaxID=103827 RepID=A0A0N5CKB4_THECL|nr:unnamed protein product [Thelazia callipaeda]
MTMRLASGSVPEDVYEAIGKLMFAYGDEAKPLQRSHQFVANVLYNQMMDTISRASNCAAQRGCKRIECLDLLFLFRKKPFHLLRIYNIVKSADLLKAFNETGEAQFDILTEAPSSSSSFCGKAAQAIYESIGLFDVTGELQLYLKDETRIDVEKRERLRRLSERAAHMDEFEYKNYTLARAYSFCAGHSIRKARIRRFLKWLGDPEIAPNALLVLNYIACEMICRIVEGALLSRKEEDMNRLDDVYPLKALQLKHYEESLRRNEAYRIGGNIVLGSYYC